MVSFWHWSVDVLSTAMRPPCDEISISNVNICAYIYTNTLGTNQSRPSRTAKCSNFWNNNKRLRRWDFTFKVMVVMLATVMMLMNAKMTVAQKSRWKAMKFSVKLKLIEIALSLLLLFVQQLKPNYFQFVAEVTASLQQTINGVLLNSFSTKDNDYMLCQFQFQILFQIETLWTFSGCLRWNTIVIF